MNISTPLVEHYPPKHSSRSHAFRPLADLKRTCVAMNAMKFLRLVFPDRAGVSSFYRVFGASLLASLFFLPVTVEGQEVMDNFNSGIDTGWSHYTPTTSGGATPTYTFPTNSPGDLGYELFGPAMTCEGLLQRGAAVRSEQYAELFYSVDLLNYAP